MEIVADLLSIVSILHIGLQLAFFCFFRCVLLRIYKQLGKTFQFNWYLRFSNSILCFSGINGKLSGLKEDAELKSTLSSKDPAALFAQSIFLLSVAIQQRRESCGILFAPLSQRVLFRYQKLNVREATLEERWKKRRFWMTIVWILHRSIIPRMRARKVPMAGSHVRPENHVLLGNLGGFYVSWAIYFWTFSLWFFQHNNAYVCSASCKFHYWEILQERDRTNQEPHIFLSSQTIRARIPRTYN